MRIGSWQANSIESGESGQLKVTTHLAVSFVVVYGNTRVIYL